MYDVTAIGELLIDFVPVSNDADGYPTLAAKAGGAPPNYLATLAKYGAKTALLSKVGVDAFGKMLIQTMKNAGVETSGIVEDPSVFTTLAFVTLDESGDRSFSFARKPGADTLLWYEEMDMALVDKATMFHFGTLSLTNEPVSSATRAAVQHAKSNGKVITFDPNLRTPLWDSLESAKEMILWGLEQADIVKISDEEVDFLWGCSEQEGIDILMGQYGVKLAMVTMGPKGAWLRNQSAEAVVSCPYVRPIDTTGAGDIFGGSAVSRILKLGKAPEDLSEEDLMKIAVFAATAASLSTQKMGGIPSVPTEDEVYAAMEDR